MSSPCLSGSTYVLDLELVKSPSRTSQISSSSSPSSTLTESSNSPLAIVSTRKARTPRKRPNQTYNEAAALLSTANPNIFSAKHFTASYSNKFPYSPHVKSITTNCTSTSPSPLLLDESSEMLLPFRVFDNSGFLLHQPVKDSRGAGFFGESHRAMSNLVMSPSCQSSCSTNTTATWEVDSMEVCEEYREDDLDFDAESMLDEEVEEGIDSIMGNLSVGNEVVDGSTRGSSGSNNCYIGGGGRGFDPWYAHPIGLSLGGRSQFGGLRIGGVRALRRVHNGNCQNFPVVDVHQISPRLNVNKSWDPNSNSNSESKPKLNSGSNPNLNLSTKLKLKLTLPNPKPRPNSEDKKKKKKKVERPISELLMSPELPKEDSVSTEESPIPELVNSGLKLKLNYDEVLDAWSDRGMPLPEEIAGAEGTDVSARLAQIDLFSENGGLREASVLRYKEKRRNRLFSKKIRYQVRKVNADRRPRMKGRFVRRPNGNLSHQKREE